MMQDDQDTLMIAICQFSSTTATEENLQKVEHFLSLSREKGADIAIFPENVLCRGTYEDIRCAAQEKNDMLCTMKKVLQTYPLYTVWGGVPILDNGNLYNTSIVCDKEGNYCVSYRKIHLFQLHFYSQISVDESTLFHPGEQSVMFPFMGWNIGLSICYDLRFPELFRAYSQADVILCTADFTHYTGKAHWEVLLRARAIESQSFVVGVNQCGKNAGLNIRSHGHSMVIDPWGTCMEKAKGEEEIIFCTLTKKKLQSIRQSMPLSLARNTKWHKKISCY